MLLIIQKWNIQKLRIAEHISTYHYLKLHHNLILTQICTRKKKNYPYFSVKHIHDEKKKVNKEK